MMFDGLLVPSGGALALLGGTSPGLGKSHRKEPRRFCLQKTLPDACLFLFVWYDFWRDKDSIKT